MAKVSKRKASKHHGVIIQKVQRKHSVSYIARWFDPNNGQQMQQSFSKLKPAVTTGPARQMWAIAKARHLAEQRAAISSGAAITSKTKITDAIESYFLAITTEGRATKTIRTYRDAATPFAVWCGSNGLRYVEAISAKDLDAYRKWLVAQKVRIPAKGKGVGQGTTVAGDTQCKPSSINAKLRGLRTMLRQWRREVILPDVDIEMITDRLRGVKVTRNQPHFLRSSALRALLQASKRHDAATYSFDRWTTASAREVEQYQYTAIYDFVVASLLTGCRFEELAGLRWSEVNLEASEILLQGERTKTGHGRRIALDITPALKVILERLRIQKGASNFVFSEPADRNVLKQQGKAVKHKDSGLSKNAADRCRKRLIEKFGAPQFTWHDLRRTCGTFLACAPALYAGAGAFHAAKRLGHSVVVSERHYAGAITDIPKDAETLEAAMGIELEASTHSAVGIKATKRVS